MKCLACGNAELDNGHTNYWWCGKCHRKFSSEAIAEIERLRLERDNLRTASRQLANQALAVLQLDFGYSAELPCRYNQHPMRHQFLWDWALDVLDGVLPDVEDTRAHEATEDAANKEPTDE